jgi:hypothetical protein
MQLRVLLLTFFISVNWAAQPTDEELGLCCLCGGCDFVAGGRADLFIDDNGTTCYDLLLDIADDTNESTPGTGACQYLQTKHRRTCCDADYDPPEVAQAPTPAPFINLPQGNEPVCNVCPDGRYPGLPKTVTAVLYIPGVNTCERLYEMGLKGLILDRLCSPLQNYLFEDCGCGGQAVVGQAAQLADKPSAPASTKPPSPAPTKPPSPAPTKPPISLPTGAASSTLATAIFGPNIAGGGVIVVTTISVHNRPCL